MKAGNREGGPIVGAPVPIVDDPELFLLRLAARGREQLLQPVGDPGHRGVDDEYARTFGAARSGHFGDVSPIGERRDAGPPELEDYPIGRGASHWSIPQGRQRRGRPPGEAHPGAGVDEAR